MKDVLGRALALLQRNLIIVVPSLVIGALAAGVAAVLANAGWLSWGFFGDLNAQGPGAFWLFFGTIVAFGLRILGALVSIAFTTGMAGAAWSRGKATFGDGFAAFKRYGVQVLVALFLLFLIGLVAAALVEPTFGISLLAYMIFMIYTMPAVVVGDRPAIDALMESMRMAARNFGVTLGLVALIVVLAVAGGAIGDAAGNVPYLGEALSWILMEVVVAYVTLVVVGEYVKLQDGGPIKTT
jgi:hypothetical protein